jgi:hypothetical protein
MAVGRKYFLVYSALLRLSQDSRIDIAPHKGLVRKPPQRVPDTYLFRLPSEPDAT